MNIVLGNYGSYGFSPPYENSRGYGFSPYFENDKFNTTAGNSKYMWKYCQSFTYISSKRYILNPPIRFSNATNIPLCFFINVSSVKDQ